MDLTYADDDDVEDLRSEWYIKWKIKNQPKGEEDQAEEINKEFGRGMIIRRRPESYVPSMEGKSYTTGVKKLCYKDTMYTLEEIIPGDGVIP